MLEWKRHAFAVDTLMKSQQEMREMLEVRAKILWFSVMKKEIFVKVALSLIRIRLHIWCDSNPRRRREKVKREKTAVLQNLAD